MASVLVTGGTGRVGTVLVKRLHRRGHAVRLLSRDPRPDVPAGVDIFAGSLSSRSVLREAVSRAEIVVHLATDPRDPDTVDVDGTQALLDIAEDVPAAPHILYLSILGVDRSDFPYFRAKYKAENRIRSSALPSTVVRSAQLHDYVLLQMDTLVADKASEVLVPADVCFQSIAVDDLVDRLVELVDSFPEGATESGRGTRWDCRPAGVMEVAGPEVLSLAEMTETYLRVRKVGAMVCSVDSPMLSSVRSGINVSPAAAYGAVTWETYLRRTLQAELQHVEFENNDFGDILRRHWIVIPAKDGGRQHKTTPDELASDTAFWTELCSLYLESEPDVCAEIRAAWARHGTQGLRFPMDPLQYAIREADRMAALGEEALMFGLAAVSIDSGRIDFRDNFLALAVLRALALRNDLDVDSAFARVAALSDDDDTRPDPPMSRMISDFATSPYWSTVMEGKDPFLQPLTPDGKRWHIDLNA